MPTTQKLLVHLSAITIKIVHQIEPFKIADLLSECTTARRFALIRSLPLPLGEGRGEVLVAPQRNDLSPPRSGLLKIKGNGLFIRLSYALTPALSQKGEGVADTILPH